MTCDFMGRITGLVKLALPRSIEKAPKGTESRQNDLTCVVKKELFEKDTWDSKSTRTRVASTTGSPTGTIRKYPGYDSSIGSQLSRDGSIHEQSVYLDSEVCSVRTVVSGNETGGQPRGIHNDEPRQLVPEHQRACAYVWDVAEQGELSDLNGHTGFGVIAQLGPDSELETQHAERYRTGFELPLKWVTDGYMDNRVCEVLYNGDKNFAKLPPSKYLAFSFGEKSFLFNPVLEAHRAMWCDWINEPRNAQQDNQWDVSFDAQGRSMTDRMKEMKLPFHEFFYYDKGFGAFIKKMDPNALPQISIIDALSIRKTKFLQILQIEDPLIVTTHSSAGTSGADSMSAGG